MRASTRTGSGTNLELLELAGFLPATLPDALHALDGDKALTGPLWPSARTALHRTQRRPGR